MSVGKVCSQKNKGEDEIIIRRRKIVIMMIIIILRRIIPLRGRKRKKT